ncbi:MAG: hypothetical protein G8237_12270 [Magnetococcales bacterium]|nr:hypothetical protein [Magnetococcales bacterium]
MPDTILATTATTATLATDGTAATNTIDISGDQDWWRVMLYAGGNYTFRQNSSTLDSYLRLLDASGNQITTNDDGGGNLNSLITYTPTTTGAYYLSAQDLGSRTGEYTLTATVTDAIPATTATTATLTTDGTSATGTIDTSGDQDWWRVTLYAGGSYSFRQNSTTLDSYLRLLDSVGTQITTNDDGGGSLNSLITYTPTTTGSYYLSAQDLGSRTGEYTLTASVALPSLTITASNANQNEGQSGTTAFSFTITRTGDLNNSSSASWSVAGSGSSPASGDDFSGGSLPSGTVTFASGQTSQTVTVTVVGDTGYESDEGFTVTLANPTGATLGTTTTASGVIRNDDVQDTIPATIATTATLNTTGTAVTGTIDSSGDQDWWRVTLSAGTTYSFRQNSSVLDSYLRLLDAAGSQIATNDDGGGGYNSLITYTPGTTGTFFLSAQDLGSRTGAYSLTASGTTPTVTATLTGPASVQEADNQAIYTVTLSQTLQSAVTVSYATSAGTATSGSDYTQTSGTLTIAAGTLSSTFAVPITNDTAQESNETFTVTLSALSTGTLGTSTLTTTILNRVITTDPTTVESTTSYTLADNERNLTLTGNNAINGTGNGLDNTITGNDAANVLLGEAGADRLTGNGGNDTLNGGSGNDILSGGTGSDALDGGSGADQMSGGPGNDIYYVNNSNDAITEDPNSGTDLVYSSIAWTLGNHLENLSLTGPSSLDGSGNSLSNTITGTTGDNTLRGFADNDNLNGLDGDDILFGGTGEDLLDGGIGADHMYGEEGDDTYTVNNSEDYVTENPSAGTDLIQSSISWTLLTNIENLTLTGSRNITGTGNGQTNTLQGNSGNNTLRGMAGTDTLLGKAGQDILQGGSGDDLLIGGSAEDTLSGGTGADRFKFSSSTEGTDTITDFKASEGDQLVFVSKNFGNIATGKLGLTRFAINATGRASTSSHRFIFNTASHTLRYDPDGNGSAPATTLAILDNVSSLSVNQIQIVTN